MKSRQKKQYISTAEFKNRLSTEKRSHPLLDRVLICLGIIGLCLVSICFIHVTWERSVFGLIPGCGSWYYGPNEAGGDPVLFGKLSPFYLSTRVTTTGEYIDPSNSTWEINSQTWYHDFLFQTVPNASAWFDIILNTLLFFSIIALLIYLLILYYKDIRKIIDAAILYAKASTESTESKVRDIKKTFKEPSSILPDKEPANYAAQEIIEKSYKPEQKEETVYTSKDLSEYTDEELNAMLNTEESVKLDEEKVNNTIESEDKEDEEISDNLEDKEEKSSESPDIPENNI